MKSSQKKLTSVRVHPKLFTKFKELCLKEDFSFQKLADRCLYLFLTDKVFKEKILNQDNISLENKNILIDEE